MNVPASNPGLRGSPYLPDRLRQEGISLALTTYPTNRLLRVGTKPDGTMSGFERISDRPMGLALTRTIVAS